MKQQLKQRPRLKKPDLNLFLGYSLKDGFDVAEAAEYLLTITREADAGRGWERRVRVVTGKEDHEKNMPRCRSFNVWARDVVARSLPGGRPYYDVIVVLARLDGTSFFRVGKATGMTCEAALSAGRPLHALPALKDGDWGAPRPIISAADMGGAWADCYQLVLGDS